jgi:hypothetical protein
MCVMSHVCHVSCVAVLTTFSCMYADTCSLYLLPYYVLMYVCRYLLALRSTTTYYYYYYYYYYYLLQGVLRAAFDELPAGLAGWFLDVDVDASGYGVWLSYRSRVVVVE